MSKRLIHIIRHGETLNNKERKIRGWNDLSLDKAGIEKAHKTGIQLRNKPIDIIATSDFIRAKDTAQIISIETRKPISLISEDFRPWDLGNLTDEKIDDVKDIMIAHVEDMPDIPIEDGESFNNFKERFLNSFCELLNKYEGLDLALVTHHRNERVIAAWINAGQPVDFEIDNSQMSKTGIEPGEYVTYEI